MLRGHGRLVGGIGMGEGNNPPEEVFEWLSYEPEAGCRAFSIISPITREKIVVELSPVTKMVTRVLRRHEFFGLPTQVHRADWYSYLDGSRLEALQRALG